jgi:hypothetical protein
MLTRESSAPIQTPRSPVRGRPGIDLVTQLGAREPICSLPVPCRRQRRSRKTADQSRCRATELKIIQVNVGHEADSSTAVYTHVSSDFMNTALRKALGPALGHPTTQGGR